MTGEEHPEMLNEAEPASSVVRPLRRLLPAEANAKTFMKDAKQIGLEAVSIVLTQIADARLLTADQIVRNSKSDTNGPVPPDIEKNVRKFFLRTLKRMDSRGISAGRRRCRPSGRGCARDDTLRPREPQDDVCGARPARELRSELREAAPYCFRTHVVRKVRRMVGAQRSGLPHE